LDEGCPRRESPLVGTHIVRGMREQLTLLRAGDIAQALWMPQACMVHKRMEDAGVIKRVAQGVYALSGSG